MKISSEADHIYPYHIHVALNEQNKKIPRPKKKIIIIDHRTRICISHAAHCWSAGRKKPAMLIPQSQDKLSILKKGQKNFWMSQITSLTKE